jgi:hypothetical protein
MDHAFTQRHAVKNSSTQHYKAVICRNSAIFITFATARGRSDAKGHATNPAATRADSAEELLCLPLCGEYAKK